MNIKINVLEVRGVCHTYVESIQQLMLSADTQIPTVTESLPSEMLLLKGLLNISSKNSSIIFRNLEHIVAPTDMLNPTAQQFVSFEVN